ncbi:MAG: helix-turn-helix domain-containing protein, partial [Myxococcales bacterium]|nr:helix-turn-helix domain-containing protein [Myxococcales bacterium]
AGLALILKASDGLPAVVEALADAWWMRGPALLGDLRPLLGGELLGEGARPPPGLPIDRVAPAWQQLAQKERLALVDLSAVPGLFDLDAAAALLEGDAPAHLRALVQRGLLRIEGPGRFRLLRLVRAFAATASPTVDPEQRADARFSRWLLDAGQRFADAGRLPEHPHRGCDLMTLFAVMEWAWASGRAEMADQASTLLMYWWDDPLPPVDAMTQVATRLGDDPRARFFAAVDRYAAGDADGAFLEMKSVVSQARNPWVKVVALNWLGSHTALQPSVRAWRAALAFYEEATNLCRALDVPWKQAHCLSCRAGLLQAAGALDEALALYAPVLAIQASRPKACHWAYNANDRARLHAERGDLAAARADSDAAIAAHAANGHPEYEALAHADRGLIEHLAGDLSAAEHHLERALSLTATAPTERQWVARICGRLAAVRADGGHHRAAERLVVEARRLIEDQAITGQLPTLGWDRPIAPLMLPLYAAFVDRANAAELLAEIDEPPGDGLLPLARRSDEARLLARILRRRDARGLRIAPDGGAFQVDDATPVSVVRFRAAHRLLAHLAAQRLSAPGEAVETDALFAAGWPGTAIDPASARNRVYAELSRLRKLGLEDWIERHEDGYRITPDAAVYVEPIAAPD